MARGQWGQVTVSLLMREGTSYLNQMSDYNDRGHHRDSRHWFPIKGTTLIQGGAMMHLVCVNSDNEGVNEMVTPLQRGWGWGRETRRH